MEGNYFLKALVFSVCRMGCEKELSRSNPWNSEKTQAAEALVTEKVRGED